MRVKRSKEEWIKVIESFYKSDLSVSEYCKYYDIVKSTFYKYKREYDLNKQVFLPVSINNEAKSDTISFEVNDVKLNINPDISTNDLAKILKALVS